MTRASTGTNARRNIGLPLLPIATSALGAAGLSLSLPRVDLPWLAIPALALIFFSWRGRTLKEAAFLGFIAGFVYFCLVFSWFGETAGALVGHLAPLLIVLPALYSALAFVAAAIGVWAAERYAAPVVVPVACALVFAATETLRGVGPGGNPFGAVAYSQAETVFGMLAAYGGTTLVTFAVALAAAVLADLAIDREGLRRSLVTLGLLAVGVGVASMAFPARRVSAATVPVAVVQGNIRQSLKWSPEALTLAIGRYSGLTASLAATPTKAAPKLIVWPETVITTDLDANTALQSQFTALAARLQATIVVGTLVRTGDTPYNTLWFFTPTGPEAVYRKRRLVPFAESLPLANVLSHLPGTQYISRFGTGTDDMVLPIAGLHAAPLICWESGFADLIAPQLRHGANLLIVSTDDAWFGESAGVFQHAQISQLRAIESGAYVIRAAATGISGIIAPDGTFTERSVLNTIASIRGDVGPGVVTPFARSGPIVWLLIAWLLYAGALLSRRFVPERIGRR